MDQKVFEKYKKIRALAASGVEGEKANAQRIMKKMEEQNPWLREEYRKATQPGDSPKEAHPRKKDASSTKRKEAEEAGRPTAKSSQQSDAESQNPRPGGVDWDKIFKFARDIYDQAEDFVDTVSQAELAQALADAAKLKSKITTAGNLNIQVSLPPEVLDELSAMNYLQLVAFRNALLQRFTQELDEILDLGKSE